MIKKILLILCILLSFNPVRALEDDIILLPDDTVEIKKDLLEGEKQVILEQKNEFNPKKTFKLMAEKDYDLNSNKGLLNDKLGLKFNKGIIKDTKFKFRFIHSFQENIDDSQSDFDYDVNKLQFGMYGRFKSEKERYNVLFEVTPDICDDLSHRFVADLWVETRRIKNNRLLFGTSRPQVGYEGGRSRTLIPFFNRSQTGRMLGNVRKTGVRLIGDYKYFDYDIGGYSSDTYYTEFLPGVETDLWVNFKPLANVSDKYGKLNLGAGFQVGERNSTNFMTETFALRYNYKKFWTLIEYANADGSNGSYGITDRKSNGYNMTLGYRLTKKLEFLLRYDQYNYDKNRLNSSRKEYSTGINYYVFGQALKVMLNYIFCQNDYTNDSHRIILGTQLIL